MFHDNIDTVVAKLMFLDGQFLQANVVLEHFPEVDSHRLADSSVDGVIDVELLQGVVTRVEHR